MAIFGYLLEPLAFLCALAATVLLFPSLSFGRIKVLWGGDDREPRNWREAVRRERGALTLHGEVAGIVGFALVAIAFLLLSGLRGV